MLRSGPECSHRIVGQRAETGATSLGTRLPDAGNARKCALGTGSTRVYPRATLPATARTLPGEACQIATAESRLTAMAAANAMV